MARVPCSPSRLCSVRVPPCASAICRPRPPRQIGGVFNREQDEQKGRRAQRADRVSCKTPMLLTAVPPSGPLPLAVTPIDADPGRNGTSLAGYTVTTQVDAVFPHGTSSANVPVATADRLYSCVTSPRMLSVIGDSVEHLAVPRRVMLPSRSAVARSRNSKSIVRAVEMAAARDAPRTMTWSMNTMGLQGGKEYLSRATCVNSDTY